jgi:hypothetical protein
MKRIAVALYIGLNLGLLMFVRLDPGHPDWQLWLSLPDKLATGTLYVQTGETRWVWSPVIAPLMALAPVIGYWAWAALHVGAVLLIRDWRLVALILVSFGFWLDTAGGNTFTFVLVAAYWALRGSKPAALVYLALCLLMPRPVQLPLAAWLLYAMPSIRLPALVLFVLHGLAVLWTGYADEWLAALIRQAGPTLGDIGPTLIFGKAWLIVGVPLGLWLLWKRRPLWAGVVVSPYMLPAYWLLPLLQEPLHHRRVTGVAERRTGLGPAVGNDVLVG